MSVRRLLEVARVDLRFQAKRPLVWVLVLIAALVAYFLSRGNLRISTGDSDVGGKKAWFTSMFAQAQHTSIVAFSLFGFFVAIVAGMTIVRDDESKVGEILHGTPLRAGEYVWGRFASAMATFVAILGLDVVFRAFSNHLLASERTAEFVGPFEAWNYAFPMIVFGLPVLLFVGGASFLVGERTRRPILVFFLPIAALLACLFFLWSWSPAWLDPRWNRVLMWIDPSGLRWLLETWLKVDRGVDFYNLEPLPVDAPFAASRVAFAAIGLACVAWSASHLRRTLRGSVGERRRARDAAAKKSVGARPAASATPLAALDMRSERPGFLSSTLEVARVEFRELRSSPGLYLFGPLILLQTVGVALSRVGFLDAPFLWTSGRMAVESLNTLSLLLCLLLGFYAVESAERERACGLAPIHGSTRVRGAAVLLGKALASSYVGAVVLAFAFAACVIAMIAQGKVGIELRPFLLVWGLVLLPTLLVWSAFVALVHAISRNRYTTYAIALAVVVVTVGYQLAGEPTWVWNWMVWDALVWSDLGTLELARGSLVLNRLAWLATAGFLVALAVRFHPRRDRDASGILAALRPRPLLGNVVRLAAVAALPLALLVWLERRVEEGFQGDAARKKAKDYWAKNVETWKDAPKPSITDVVLDLELDPARSWFRAKGTYGLTNVREEPLRKIALTPGLHFVNREWTLDGAPATPEDRAGLAVFALDDPLE